MESKCRDTGGASQVGYRVEGYRRSPSDRIQSRGILAEPLRYDTGGRDTGGAPQVGYRVEGYRRSPSGRLQGRGI